MGATKTNIEYRHFLLSSRYNFQTSFFGTKNGPCSPSTNNRWHAEVFFSSPRCICFVSLLVSSHFHRVVVVSSCCCSHGSGCCCWSRCCDFRACLGDVARQPLGAAAALQQRKHRHTLTCWFFSSLRDSCHRLLAAPPLAREFEAQNPPLSSPAFALVASAVTRCWHWIGTSGRGSSSADTDVFERSSKWKITPWRCCCCYG